MPIPRATVTPDRLLTPAPSGSAVLEHARLAYWERPGEALETAIRCQEQARLGADRALQSRALALQGAISLHRGDVHGCVALAAEADRLAAGDLHAQAEVAALKAHLHFFSGSYAQSLQWARTGVELADRTDDLRLRLHARRMGCLAFGNVGVDDLEERFEEVLELACEVESPWEEAVARNDLAHLRMTENRTEEAEQQLRRGLELAGELTHADFLRGVLHATRSELRLTADRAAEALEDARRAVHFVASAGSNANPYLLGMAILTEVRALLALGRVEDAQDAGESAVERLGDRVPQARSMILSAVAEALREAGRAEEAYDTLKRCAALERQALQEFAELQLGLERARLEAAASRREADALALKNRELEEQADRDWLTGLHNRRYLARANDVLTTGEPLPLSLAVLDLDHFKSVNDRFGHHVGDEVLVRVAGLLDRQVRGGDMVVRTGGEEFTVVMPGAGPEEAAACCERLCRTVAEAPWNDLAPGLTLTVSIGVASHPFCDDIGELQRTADERLYAAKRAGRARVVAA
jgi:diguanylate cyclase (GGDEF)-like protein